MPGGYTEKLGHLLYFFRPYYYKKQALQRGLDAPILYSDITTRRPPAKHRFAD